MHRYKFTPILDKLEDLSKADYIEEINAHLRFALPRYLPNEKPDDLTWSAVYAGAAATANRLGNQIDAVLLSFAALKTKEMGQ